MIKFNGVSKFFEDGKEKRIIIDNSSIIIPQNKVSGIIGRSGLGKSTVLKMILGLINPDEGTIEVDGQVIDSENAKSMEKLRRVTTGSVFQNFNLINSLTVEENIMLPRFFYENGEVRIKNLLDLLGLPSSILGQSVNTISGGEKQRVAIARALINNPKLLLADEPTGNLDLKNENSVIELFKRINKELDLTILLVTHSKNMALNMDKLYTISDYKIIETEYEADVKVS